MTEQAVAVHPGRASGRVEVREQILQAATDALLKHGFSGTSLRIIAAEAGLPLGNVQHYFPTKAQLMIDVWRYVTEQSMARLASSLEDIAYPERLMEEWSDGTWGALKGLADLQLVAYDLLLQAPKDETLRAFLPELFAGYRHIIEEQLDRFERETNLRVKLPREVVVPLLMNTVLGFGLFYVTTGDDETCDRALEAFRHIAASMIEPA